MREQMFRTYKNINSDNLMYSYLYIKKIECCATFKVVGNGTGRGCKVHVVN